MQSSSTITKISAALVKAQSEMGNAKKETTNPFFKKNYADLNSIREAVLPALNSHGISAIQPTCVIEGLSYVETVLLHESGEFISSLTPIITASATDPQKHGSGLSYARRYALQSILNIGAEDDDANAAGKTPPQQPAAPAKVLPAMPAKELDKFVKSLLAGEPGVSESIKKSYTISKEQGERLNQAVAFRKTKQPLYSLLNTANFSGNEAATEKKAVDECATETQYQELHKSLTAKQPA